MNYRDSYLQQGFLSPIDIVDEATAAEHRMALEKAEAENGPVHYLTKMHIVMPSAAELASHPRVLDLVEQLIGPDILVYNVTYIIKEKRSASHVSWHQDLTYWGLDGDEVVSMWLALSDAGADAGCMRMLPRSHTWGRQPHIVGEADEHNVLNYNQRVAQVDESAAVTCPLKPGQASFHHGWLLHASAPNRSDDRRIGLNVQYVSPRVRQISCPGYSAWLVRGEDRYGHYVDEQPAQEYFGAAGVAARERMQQLYHEIARKEKQIP